MPTAVRETIQVLELIVQAVPLGTNVGLLYMLWAMLNGSFLSSRGGIFPALQASGYDAETSRRSWAAFRYGAWTIGELIEVWQRHVVEQGKWQERRYEGYRVLAVDWTAFWRPKLQGWQGRFFHRLAGRAVKGVGMGVAVEVGEVEGQRLPLLRRLLRLEGPRPESVEGADMSESQLKAETLQWLGKTLGEDEIVVMDAGVKVSECQAAKIERWVVRLALNATARRNFLPEDKKRGRPSEYGQLVRPFARTYKEHTLAASQPDVQVSFSWQGRTIQAHGWCDLVLPTLKPDPHHATFSIWLFFDPAYEQPLLLASALPLAAASVFAIYLDRWPVEQVPLAAKQMLGLHRQFVSAPEACQRLPELALLAGNILTYLAAILPPVPTGFWDKHPKKLLAACAGFWRKPIFSLGMKNMANFAKRTPPLHTCPRELMPIAAENAILSSLSGLFLSFC